MASHPPLGERIRRPLSPVGQITIPSTIRGDEREYDISLNGTTKRHPVTPDGKVSIPREMRGDEHAYFVEDRGDSIVLIPLTTDQTDLRRIHLSPIGRSTTP